MKRFYHGIIIAIILLCGAFFVACKKEKSEITVVDNSKIANITMLETNTDEKLTITVNKSELTYSEIGNASSAGLKVCNENGESMKVRLVSEIKDALGRIAYGEKTLKYEVLDKDGNILIAFTRKVVVTEKNRPTYESQSCDLSEIKLDYAQKDDYGIDLGYTELQSIIYNGTVLTEDEYTVQVLDENVALSQKAVFINGSFLQNLGAGIYDFEIVTSFGYNNYQLTVTDAEKARYIFDGSLDENYIITDPEYVLPLITTAENCYQNFEAEYALLYDGKKVEDVTKDGEYIYRVTVKKQGFENETKDFAFYYLNEKNKNVFIDPMISAQYMDNYSVKELSTLSFVENEERSYYLQKVKSAYSRSLNSFSINPAVLRDAIAQGLTNISVDVKVADDSELSQVEVMFYTMGDVIWQSTTKYPVNKDGWTTISVDLMTIQHWQDSTLKGFVVEQNGAVKTNISSLSITTNYGENGEQNINYGLMYSNIRMGETQATISGYYMSEDGVYTAKFDQGTLTLIKNNVEQATYYVTIYKNGLIKVSLSQAPAHVLGSNITIAYVDGNLTINGKAYSAMGGTKENPYVYDFYN